MTGPQSHAIDGLQPTPVGSTACRHASSGKTLPTPNVPSHSPRHSGGMPMRFDEYRRHDATALAGLIAKGEVSAKEVLETAIARAEAVNPAINAVVHKQYDQARRAVDAGLAN